MSADEKARRPERISRSFKYVILILSVILTLKVVFDAYSYYVARRDIDSELRSKKISSIEHLNVLAARERALAIMTLEERCNERVQITLFRILDAKLHDEIQRAFYEFIILKNAMVKAVEDFGPGTIDVNKPTDHLKKFTKRINDFDFKLSELDEYLDVGDEIKKTDRYQQLRDEINKNTKQYIDVGVKYKSARDKSDDFLKQNKEEVSALKLRVNYIDELREKRKELTGKIGELDDVLARYTVWTDALSGGATASSMLDEVAYKIRELDDVTLKHAKCDDFKDFYQMANRQVLATEPMNGKAWSELGWGQAFGIVPRAYQRYLLRFFKQPPAAQTLLVTLFLGALGALTLNMLRMSRLGWWASQNDPRWGEIVVGPLLGALAAFGIFLIGSAGLLLTADTNGAQPLSAYFIGLLGFLSGLMYDEAFARVRRIGNQMFAAKSGEDTSAVHPQDQALAEILKANGASLAASLILKYRIGAQVSTESEFTLLLPSDDAIGRLPLTTWTRLNDPLSDAFKKWYNRHHAAKRLTRKDIAGDGTKAGITELSVDDGTKFVLAIDQGELKIGDIRVQIPDVIWGTGVVHILSQDLP